MCGRQRTIYVRLRKDVSSTRGAPTMDPGSSCDSPADATDKGVM